MHKLTLLLTVLLGAAASTPIMADDGASSADEPRAATLALADESDDGPDRGDEDRDRPDDGHHGDKPGPDDRRGFDRRPLTDEQIDAAVEIVRRMHPKWAEEIDRAMDEHPERVRQMISRNPRLRYMLELRERNPELFELRIEDARLSREQHELSRDLRAAREEGDEAEADQLHGRLVEVVTEHFDIRQRIREIELKQLEARLDELRHELEERTEQRDKLIDERVAQIVEHGPRPRW